MPVEGTGGACEASSKLGASEGKQSNSLGRRRGTSSKEYAYPVIAPAECHQVRAEPTPRKCGTPREDPWSASGGVRHCRRELRLRSCPRVRHGGRARE